MKYDRTEATQKLMPDPCHPKKMSTADEIVDMANELRLLADTVCNRTYQKLSPVMGMEKDTVCEESVPRRSFPPLFEELRNSFEHIRSSLDQIDDAIRRTEL